MKKLLLVVGAVSMSWAVFAADTLETFYWTSTTGGKWTDVANWSTDAAGKNPASRYPGGDPDKTLDEAQFVKTATGTVEVDADVSLARFLAAQDDKDRLHPLVFTSGGGAVHSISMTYLSDSSAWRSKVEYHRVALFTNLVLNVTYLDANGYTTFGRDVTVNVNKCLRKYNSNGRLTIDPGATVIVKNGSVFEYRLNNLKTDIAGDPITVNGGTISSEGTGRMHIMHHGTRLLYRGGTITCPIQIGNASVAASKSPDDGAILSVGAGVTLNSDGLLTFDGGVLANEVGGVLNVNQPLTVKKYMAIGPYDVPGKRGAILTMAKSVGDLAALDIRQDAVNFFSNQFSWGIDTDNDVQTVWVDGNLYPDVKDETTGYVKQILGSSSNKAESNNTLGRADAWSDGLYPHSDTNYASAGFASTIVSNIVFAGRSYTLDGNGLFRFTNNGRRIEIADFRLGAGKVNGANRPCVMSAGEKNCTQYLAGKLTIFCKKTAPYLPYIGGGGTNHVFVIESQLVGDETAGFEVRAYQSPQTDVEDPGATNRVRFVGDTSGYFGRVLVKTNARMTIGPSPFPGEVMLDLANHGLAVDETVADTALLGQLSTATNVTGSAVDVPAERTLVVTNGLALISPLAKCGAGTLALGGAAVRAGDDAAFTVASGAVKPLTAQAIGTVPVTFGAGAGIVLDWTPADAAVVAKGLDLSASTVTFDDETVPVAFDFGGVQPAKEICRKALLTVKSADAEGLTLDVKRPVGFAVSVTSETVGDLTTFYADCVPKGLLILIK